MVTYCLICPDDKVECVIVKRQHGYPQGIYLTMRLDLCDINVLERSVGLAIPFYKFDLLIKSNLVYITFLCSNDYLCNLLRLSTHSFTMRPNCTCFFKEELVFPTLNGLELKANTMPWLLTFLEALYK